MNQHQRPKSIANDILAEPAVAPLGYRCLNDLLADNLSHGDLVVINGLLHKFQYKAKGAGPHVFFDTNNQKTANFYTAELINLMNDGSYIRPGGSATSTQEITTETIVCMLEGPRE
jgi:hypothetical protein